MAFLIFLFSLAAVLWMIPIIHGGRLFRLATLVLLVGTVLGPDFFAINGPIQFSLDRILWFAMIVFAVIQWRLGNVRAIKLTRADWIVFGTVVFILFSVVSKGGGPYFKVGFSRWLFYILMPAGVYMVARMSEIREADIRWFSKAVLGLGVYLSITGIFEVIGFSAGVYPKHIMDPKVWEFFGRARGPLLNPIGNGFILSFGIVSCVLSFFASGRRMRIIYFGLTMLLCAGAYATLTRSVWVGVMCAVGVIALTYSPRWLRVLGLATAVLLGGAMSLGLKEQLLSLKRDKNLSAAEAAKSLELRPLLAIVAWEMFKDKPITGHGFGRYFDNNKPYHNTREYGVQLGSVKKYIQHNTFLGVLVDTGMVGLMLLVGFLVTLAAIGLRLSRERKSTVELRHVGLLVLGIIGAYLPNAMFHDMWIIPMVQMYLLFVAGIAVTVFQHGFSTGKQAGPVVRERVGAPAMN